MHRRHGNEGIKPILSHDTPQEGAASPSSCVQGLVSGTQVASKTGWRPAETLRVGDEVMTFDNGIQPVADIHRLTLWIDDSDAVSDMLPVTVPADGLGNVEELILLPEQGVLVEHEAVSDPFGDPFVVVPAQALVGLCGVHRAGAQRTIRAVTVRFASEEVIYIEGGLMIHCPAVEDGPFGKIEQTETLYDICSLQKAREFLFDCDAARQALGLRRKFKLNKPHRNQVA